MSELQQQKRPWYTEDFLYIIAERLLARIPDGGQIDFCHQNPYTWFMGHNQIATRTIISQFAKFKKINFGREKQITFFKNANLDDSQPEEFGGPYIVPPGMLEYIIENGKFRVNTINVHDFIPDDHSIDIKELGEMNSLKAFCALFLGKQIQIPDGLNNNLMVEKFWVWEPAMSIQNNFEAILAIDAVELEIAYVDLFKIDCSQYKSHIIANNTTKITVNCYCQLDCHKLPNNVEAFCSFLVRVCPNLNNLHIEISLAINDIPMDEFTENLYSTIKAIEAGIKSINIGNEHLQITIELEATFDSDEYNDLPLQSHDLFKLGTPYVVDDMFFVFVGRYVARSLEFVDVRGRTHKLQFKIVENTFDWDAQ